MAATAREALQGVARGEVTVQDGIRAAMRSRHWQVHGVVELPDGTSALSLRSDPDAQPGRRGLDVVRDAVPDGVGLALDLDEAWSLRWGAEHVASLRVWADITEVEEALLHPGPDQVDVLRRGPWVGVVDGAGQLAVHRHQSHEVVTLYTAPDRAQRFVAGALRGLRVAEIAGPWDQLADRTDFDAVRVDPLSPGHVVLEPHVPAALARGEDPRPGALPLPARTAAEIHLWLDQHGAWAAARSHALRRTPAGLVAVYTAQFEDGWRSIPFEPVEPTADPEDLGEGPTRILCAGALHEDAYGVLAGLPDDPARLDPGHRPYVRRAARWLAQVLEVAEGGQIPFGAVRTPRGAAYWRRHPDRFELDAVVRLHRRAGALV